MTTGQVFIEIFSDPDGKYMGTLLVDPDRLPLKRFCGLFYWRLVTSDLLTTLSLAALELQALKAEAEEDD